MGCFELVDVDFNLLRDQIVYDKLFLYQLNIFEEV